MSHNSAICTNTVACNELNEHCKCFSLSEGILECIVRMSHDMSPHSNMWEHGPHSSIVAASKHTLWCEGLINVDLIIWCMLKVWHDACRRDKHVLWYLSWNIIGSLWGTLHLWSILRRCRHWDHINVTRDVLYWLEIARCRVWWHCHWAYFGRTRQTLIGHIFARHIVSLAANKFCHTMKNRYISKYNDIPVFKIHVQSR